MEWSSISTGYYHTVALQSDGSLWAWGYNYYGQLGDGSTTNKLLPTLIDNSAEWSYISAGGTHTVALQSNGTLWTWGDNQYGQLGDGTTEDKHIPSHIERDL